MKNIAGVVILVALAVSASPLLVGCGSAMQGEGGEEETTANSEALNVAAAGPRLNCRRWNASCRSALYQKLLAAKVKDTNAVLSAMDQLALNPAFVSNTSNPNPPPGWIICGSYGIVHLCCNGNGPDGSTQCDATIGVGWQVEW